MTIKLTNISSLFKTKAMIFHYDFTLKKFPGLLRLIGIAEN
jgi:hypothetical protein